MSPPRWLGVLLAALLLMSACGEEESLTVGTGALPGAVPEDFPIPSEAEVGAFVVDHLNNRSEFILVVPWTVTAASEYFLVNMVNAGYVVERSQDGEGWTISFQRDTLQGTAAVTETEAGARVLVRINRA